ncbi:MAG: hypothetical protein ACLTJN_01925 [Monoglobus pectinilyticus]
MLRKRVTWSVTIAVLTLLMCFGVSQHITSFMMCPMTLGGALHNKS